MKARMIFLVFLLAVSAGAAHADPAARIGASYYYIEGNSALVLTAQMENKGPTGPDGRHHPALTKWDVQWRFRHNMLGGVCKMEKVSVMVGVTTVRPRWRGEKEGAAQLRKRWGELVKAVDRNVEFHKQQALEAGRKIEAALNSLEPTGDCDALTVAANQAATVIREEYEAVSRNYNDRTDYGRKDGLSLI
jgi:predicted secreted Zn-dependent protease